MNMKILHDNIAAYPDFITHIRNQKTNFFNIGMAFLTLSLSSQLVAASWNLRDEKDKVQECNARILLLEKVLHENAIPIPLTFAEKKNMDDMEMAQKAALTNAKVLPSSTNHGIRI